uniref:ATP dependent DNA ligase n=1 Tax=Streptomyces sp. NBC_01592 TaxID=2975889 RepID=UPI002F90E39D
MADAAKPPERGALSISVCPARRHRADPASACSRQRLSQACRRPSQAGRRRPVALASARTRAPGLCPARAGHRVRAAYVRRPRPAERPACPFDKVPRVAGARWVLPRLVGEVRYTGKTRAGLLRHPSWHLLRPDLAPDDLM